MSRDDHQLRDENARAEQARLQRRQTFLIRKASRLPLRSNGRRKAMVEVATLGIADRLIAHSLAGGKPPKVTLAGRGRHGQRAARILATFQST